MKIQNAFNGFYNEFKEWTKEEILKRTFDIILESSDKDRQLEAYENMRKEVIEYIHDKFDRFDCDGNLGISMQISYCVEDLLNILNKVGENNDTK